jgi:hypothetical protein
MREEMLCVASEKGNAAGSVGDRSQCSANWRRRRPCEVLVCATHGHPSCGIWCRAFVPRVYKLWASYSCCNALRQVTFYSVVKCAHRLGASHVLPADGCTLALCHAQIAVCVRSSLSYKREALAFSAHNRLNSLDAERFAFYKRFALALNALK